jgi:SAM-dependent methyltransferase
MMSLIEKVNSYRKSLVFSLPKSKAADGSVKLNLGCGDKLLKEYINIDVAPSRKGKRPDFISDVRRLRLPDNYADEVLTVHVIEHFYYWEAEAVVREWVRVLKSGGKLIVECPNLETAAKKVLASPETATLPGKEGQESMWVFYGDPNWKDPLMCHRWGYTPASLITLMQACGLQTVRQEPAEFKKREPRDMRIVGIKP